MELTNSVKKSYLITISRKKVKILKSLKHYTCLCESYQSKLLNAVNVFSANIIKALFKYKVF